MAAPQQPHQKQVLTHHRMITTLQSATVTMEIIMILYMILQKTKIMRSTAEQLRRRRLMRKLSRALNLWPRLRSRKLFLLMTCLLETTSPTLFLTVMLLRITRVMEQPAATG